MAEEYRNDSASQRLYQRAKALIPGGTQLLSKRPELFAPNRWPAYFQSASGCEVVDLDGRRFLDLTHNGVGACLLGYAHPQVTEAVIQRIRAGSICSLNSPDEVYLAEEMLEIHPWAEQARFARGGGESLSIAVRLARAATGRDIIAFCGYHGWTDWYLAANLHGDQALNGHLLPGLSPAGVPRGLRGTALPFRFNQIDELRKLVAEHGQQLAAVVMEPLRKVLPLPGFLADVRQLCDDVGARLIFDEVTSGFRFRLGGWHLESGVVPDVAVFAKALGSGHPIGAIIGQASTMEAAQETFVSSTYWTDGVGPVAARATLAVCRDVDVPGHVRHIGTLFQVLCRELAERHQLPLTVQGPPALTALGFDHPAADALMTLFTVRMLDHGILAGGGFYPTLAHQPDHLSQFAAAADEVCAELRTALLNGDFVSRLQSPVKQSGFARLT